LGVFFGKRKSFRHGTWTFYEIIFLWCFLTPLTEKRPITY
jgi:hypothetical protein